MRLDDWLVQEGFVASQKEAEGLILAGRIWNKERSERLEKPGMKAPKNKTDIFLEPPPRFVGRGGEKLESFLHDLDLQFEGEIALDIGSSTGGFTDCLLQRGVEKVIAVDVGKAQLHEKLKSDPRVVSLEEFDSRKLSSEIFEKEGWPSLVTIDVSFISLTSIVPSLFKLLPRSTFILLFKPQFEIAREIPKKGGVAPTKESELALQSMLQFLSSIGLNPKRWKPSALKGAKKGNQEIFIMAEAELSKHIFRTYDIRGVGDRDLLDPHVERIARAFARRVVSQFGSGAPVGLGRDERLSSPRIHSTFTQALEDEGVQVMDLGPVTTPMSYFALYHFDLKALVQITASHNPKDDNGFKMMFGRDTLFGAEIENLYREALAIDFSSREKNQNKTGLKPQNIHEALKKAYLQFLHREFKFSRKYKIVLDCGNGMAGAFAREVFEPFASDLKILYEKVDCRFPNHEADPTVEENLKDLRKEVKSSGAEIGFAFDGDADRLGVITRSGRIIWGDEILMLLSELVLKQKPGSTIIGEVKCSEKLFQMVASKGGKPLMYRTGHSLIKKKMKEVGAPIAGEMSGHLFFSDRYFGFDDATYAALRVLEVMDQLGLSDLDAWIGGYPSMKVTPEIRVPCEEAEKAEVVARVKETIRSKGLKGAVFTEIDGVRVSFADGAWALVRASNTQAVLVVRIEAPSSERLEELRKILEEALGKPIRV